MSKFPRYILLINILSIFAFLGDRFVRWYFFYTKKSFFIIDNFFELKFQRNTGIAFSIPVNKWLLYILIIIILLFLINLLIRAYQSKKFFTIAALTLVIMGALSNLIDRFKYGFIIDYIWIWILPIFNIADLMVVGGICLLLWRNFFANQHEKIY
jgi:signal peptidase II